MESKIGLAFAAARGDKWAVRPFAKLFWTVIIIIVIITLHSLTGISGDGTMSWVGLLVDKVQMW